MQPEAAREVREWLRRARNDLRGAEIDLAAEPPLVEDALFHAQQAVEKALKAFLTAHDRPFRKTHDIDELARVAEGLDPGLAGTLEPARNLTPFAWRFRYPGESAVPSRAEGEEALAVARAAVAAVVERLPSDARPWAP
jgi:HEPN domain-containing protein